MIKTLILVALAGSLAGAALCAPPNPLPTVNVEQYQLSNGLTVFLVEDHTLPIVAVNINYRVGSKNEKPGRTGFAHLFEHMMFQGSKHWNDDFFKPLQEIGGEVNGGTNTDRTRYWTLVPAGYLERALWLEADRMGFLLEAMTPVRLANQVSVVQNERRQNYDNRPYGTVMEKMAAAAFPPNHPYSWLTIGAMADIQAATLDDVREFFRAYYTPNNASLCVAGDFKPEEAKAHIRKYFGDIPPGPPVSKIGRWVPRLEGEIVLDIQDRVKLPRAYLSWFTTPRYAGDEAALTVFARVLGDGKTSRLHQALVRDQQLAQDVTVNHSALEISGSFLVTLTPRPGHTLDEVEAAALAVLNDTLQNGITAEELGRVQADETARALRGMQRVGGFGGISDSLNEYYHYLGKADMFQWDLQRFLDLTPESVTAAARKYLGPDRVRARVSPMPDLKAETAGAATETEREKVPGKAAGEPFRFPAPERFRLANGLEVVLAERHKLPLVTLAVVIKSGSASDPAGRAGLADLTAALLAEGAGGKSSKDFAEALEGKGARLSIATERDVTKVSLSTMKDRLGETLPLLADAVMRPDFPDDELDRERKARLVRLMQQRDQTALLAQSALLGVLFGGHPYGHPSLGTPEGLTAVTLEDVRANYAERFGPAQAVLVVAGDLTRAELEKALAGNLAAWSAGARAGASLPEPPRHPARTLYIVNKPGAAQSHILIGSVGAARASADHAALEAANGVLGGQFVSRLNMNLREDKGYTYGCRSRFTYGVVPYLFSASAPVQTRVTAAAVSEMVKEIAGMAGARPVTAEELAFARGSLVDGYARDFETLDQIVSRIADLAPYGLPDDELETWPARVGALTPDLVNAAARKHLHPDQLAIVVVGDKAAIAADLARLDLGPVVEVDEQGRPVAR
ncbi:MAG: insulinase family protein [Acidobacteria bacterium]|nr:insulinase family protein [Acidobacteriota bacterium]